MVPDNHSNSVDPPPSARLVTQNLIFSAASAEQRKKVDLSQIRDLASLIDIFCLYDEIHVLGREVNTHDEFQAWSLYKTFQSTGVMHTDYVPDEVITPLVQRAINHMQALTDDSDDGGVLPGLKSVPPEEIARLLQSMNDNPEKLHEGREWIHALSGQEWLSAAQLVPDDTSRINCATYFTRTFLYAAYAQQNNLPLTSEVARMPLLEKIVDSEKALADKLLKELKAAGQDTPARRFPELRKSLSPLAAVVFERAARKPSNLPDEMEHLRDELAPLRKRLRKAEYEILQGDYDRVEVAAQHWEEVFDELRRTFGGDPNVISFDGLIDFSKASADVVDNPTSKKSWISAIIGMPVSVVRRLLMRRPLLEIHRFRKELGGDGRLMAAVQKLFPDFGQA
jgi:hypothetical protein